MSDIVSITLIYSSGRRVGAGIMKSHAVPGKSWLTMFTNAPFYFTRSLWSHFRITISDTTVRGLMGYTDY